MKVNDAAIRIVMDEKTYHWNPEKCFPLVVLGAVLAVVAAGVAMSPFVVWVLGR